MEIPETSFWYFRPVSILFDLGGVTFPPVQFIVADTKKIKVEFKRRQNIYFDDNKIITWREFCDMARRGNTWAPVKLIPARNEDRIRFNVATIRTGAPDLATGINLFDAIKRGNLNDVAMLLDNGEDANSEDFGTGLSALKWACSVYCSTTSRTAIVKCLLEHGARDPLALHIAAAESNIEVVKLLVKSGWDPNCRKEYGITVETPLECAIQAKQKYGTSSDAIIEYLRQLQNGNQTSNKVLVGVGTLNAATDTSTGKFHLDCPTEESWVKSADVAGWQVLHVGKRQDFRSEKKRQARAPFYVREISKTEDDELIILYEIPGDYGGSVQVGVCVWDGNYGAALCGPYMGRRIRFNATPEFHGNIVETSNVTGQLRVRTKLMGSATFAWRTNTNAEWKDVGAIGGEWPYIGVMGKTWGDTEATLNFKIEGTR
jgi:hypothetical protein